MQVRPRVVRTHRLRRHSTDYTAMMIEICRLVGYASDRDPPLISQVVGHLSTALRPFGPSSSQANFAPPPNVHVAVLRCLLSMPHETWDGQLIESEMGVIMEGLNSPDNTIRRAVSRQTPNNGCMKIAERTPDTTPDQ